VALLNLSQENHPSPWCKQRRLLWLMAAIHRKYYTRTIGNMSYHLTALQISSKRQSISEKLSFWQAMVLATMTNHPFSSPRRHYTASIATQSCKSMYIWFVVKWYWLLVAWRVQKRRCRELARTLQCTCHAHITTNNTRAITCKQSTFKNNVKDAT